LLVTQLFACGSTAGPAPQDPSSDLHAEVDARFSGSFEGNAADYAGFLASMAAVLPPLERALEDASIHKAVPDWDERRRASLLLDDLHALGAAPPREADPPSVDGEARQLGIVYVLEGSRLGGKLLLRRALNHPDSRVRAATRYLSHGAGRDLWSSFLVRLEASAAVNGAPNEAVAGARAAFALFGDRAAHG
jgi:heme oxygenase